MRIRYFCQCSTAGASYGRAMKRSTWLSRLAQRRKVRSLGPPHSGSRVPQGTRATAAAARDDGTSSLRAMLLSALPPHSNPSLLCYPLTLGPEPILLCCSSHRRCRQSLDDARKVFALRRLSRTLESIWTCRGLVRCSEIVPDPAEDAEATPGSAASSHRQHQPVLYRLFILGRFQG